MMLSVFWVLWFFSLIEGQNFFFFNLLQEN